MITLIRHFILFITVALLAYSLPRLFDTLLFERTSTPSLSYSAVKDDFYLGTRQNKKMNYQSVSTGENYTWEGMESKLPLRSYRQLTLDKRAPESINGVSISIAEIEAWKKRFKYDPRWQDAPDYSIFQLFESNGKYAELQGEDQLVRVADKITVYRTESNQALEQASVKLQRRFDEAGFKFPAQLAVHNSKSNKPYEEGLYAIDQKGDLFHGLILNGEFIIYNISQLPEETNVDLRLKNLNVAYVLVDESYRGDIRALIIDASNRLYLMKKPGYQLLELPSGDFDYTSDRFSLAFNPVYMDLTISRDGQRDKYIIDHQGKLLNQYSQPYPDQSSHWSQQLKLWLLPFKLKLHDNKHVLASPVLSDFSKQVIFLHLFLLTICIIWRVKQNKAVLHTDLLWIVSSGIFGLIALALLPKNE
jgi:hypothetical protein